MTTLTLAELAQDVQAFLRFKRAMGFSYQRGELMLESLQRFARKRSGVGRRLALDETLKGWLSRSEGRKANSIAQEFAVVRQLCLHRRRRDPHGFVPERAWVPKTELPFLPLSDRQYRAANAAVRKEVLGAHTPALTIIITGIYDEEWLLEIEAIAAA